MSDNQKDNQKDTQKDIFDTNYMYAITFALLFVDLIITTLVNMAITKDVGVYREIVGAISIAVCGASEMMVIYREDKQTGREILIEAMELIVNAMTAIVIAILSTALFYGVASIEASFLAVEEFPESLDVFFRVIFCVVNTACYLLLNWRMMANIEKETTCGDEGKDSIDGSGELPIRYEISRVIRKYDLYGEIKYTIYEEDGEEIVKDWLPSCANQVVFDNESYLVRHKGEYELHIKEGNKPVEIECLSESIDCKTGDRKYSIKVRKNRL